MSCFEKKEKVSSKDALLEAASELFAVKGYLSVSTREIAERAGVNLGAIQYHFGSKAELFVESLKVLMNKRWKSCIGNLFGEDVPLDVPEARIKFCRFIYLFMYDVCFPEGTDTFRMVRRELLSADPESEELTGKLINTISKEYFFPFKERLVKLISKILPHFPESELGHLAGDTIAICTSFALDVPFIELLRGYNPLEEPHFDNARRQKAEFILRGIGLSDLEVRKTIESSESFLRKVEND